MDDFFDDIDTIVPTTRAKTGSRFAPKAKPKPKQSIQKNVSASSENAVSSKDGNNVLVDSSTTHKESEGISQNESHNVVAVSSSVEEPISSGHNRHINVNNAQPVQPANAVESVLNNVAAPSTNCATIGRSNELPANVEGSFLDRNKSLEVIDNSLEVSLNVGFKSASGDSNTVTGIYESNIHSNFGFGEVQEVLSSEFEFDPFSNVLPDPGTRNAKKFQPKIKPRPRVSNAPATASSGLGIPFSEDNISLEAVIPSHPDSPNAMTSEAVVHDGTRDLPSSFGKSAAETADIFSGLESLDDIRNQASTGIGKPDLKSFNVKGTEENLVFPGYDSKSRSETQEGADLNADCPIDNVYDYQSMKSGTDPTSEIPRHEGLTNSADSPTLADLMQQDGIGEKEDANERKKSVRKNKRSSIAGVEDKGSKTSRKTRKQSVHKTAKNSLNEPIEDDDDVLDPPYEFDGDELEENDGENEVDDSSKKKRASTSSKKKSVAKNGKTSGKRKKANDDLDKVTEKPPKKFPHSSRRRKRCVDKALLDDEYLDQRTLPLRDIILLAEHKERLAKKEGTTTNTSSTNQSNGDFLHEADANNEDEFYGSDDGYRDPYDDQYQASENITSTAPLLNYQSFMDKTPRAKWSKQETELFYVAVSFSTDFAMIQQNFFPNKTRRQVKLKFKKEERQNPLQLADALNNHATDLSKFKSLAEKLGQTSNKAEQDTARDAPDFMPGEEVEELTPETNEEVAATQQEQDHINVKDQEDSVAYPVPGQSDDDDDDDDDDGGEHQLLDWSQYQSSI
ncbi:unnamed protein product [Trifolium pratense]|uniref:Uncharacterized protein n=1 Tax=Trifolium pratense TaxID=57577 RepID=A0ACB0M524_TRIPR|nr:unnamed protein product [Trifolium pratense]